VREEVTHDDYLRGRLEDIRLRIQCLKYREVQRVVVEQEIRKQEHQFALQRMREHHHELRSRAADDAGRSQRKANLFRVIGMEDAAASPASAPPVGRSW